MARIDYADPSTLEGLSAKAFENAPPINIFRMLAHTGPLFGRFMQFGGGILSETELDPELRELAILRVGHLSGAAYEVQQHETISRQMKMREELIAAARTGETKDLTEIEAQVMAYTDDVLKNVKASDATFNPLLDKLGARQLQELTITIGFYMLVSRYLETFEVDLEDGEVPDLASVTRTR
ncbi:MAG: carboxymuconolactone decarboxylase family protein [Pseudomonadota bacterium]